MNTIAVIVEYDSGSKRQRFMLPTDVSTEKLSTTIAKTVGAAGGGLQWGADQV